MTLHQKWYRKRESRQFKKINYNMINTPGQHHRSTQLGKIIYDFCSLDEIKTIVEIGTWNGLGTTKCILDAIVDSNKKDYKVFSLECNKSFFDIAVQNNGGREPIPNFHLIHGTIVNEEDFLDPMYNFNDKFFHGYPNSLPHAHDSRSQHREWMLSDLEGVRSCENVLGMLPEKIDLLILDGGGFAGFAEFERLKDRTTYFILDDVESTKNDDVAEFIRKNDEYEVLIDVYLDESYQWKYFPEDFQLHSPNNGLMVAKKKNKK